MYAIVAEGVGRVSYLEAAWIMVGLLCLNDAFCLLVRARRQMAAALGPARDPVEWWLAVMDHRSAGATVLVQACFVLVGVIAALQPPAPRAADENAVLGLLALALFLAIQGINLVTGRMRGIYTRRIDAYLRAHRPRRER